MRLVQNPKLLDCYFKNGMMILPYYHSIIETRLNNQTFAGECAQKAPLYKSLISLLGGVFHCKIKQKNVLIFSSTLFNVQRDGHYYNSLHGYYYDLYPDDTLLIEDSDSSYIWRTKNSYENLSLLNTYIELICLVLRKICHAFAPIHRKDYDVFIEEYPNLFDAATLSKADYFTKFYAFFIRRVLKRVKPKVVLINCGSYGHTKAVVCYVARQMGIKVIEPQHGVTYNCQGYIAPDFILDSKEYGQYLPDALFTFGSYWNEFVNWKYEKVSVGNPYLNEYAAKIENVEITHDFLIISQPIDKDSDQSKVNFVKALSNTFPDKRILLRLHPSENYSQQKAIYDDCPNIEISCSTKVLYEDIKRSRYVIGWFSTCLFECLAFNRVPIIVDTSLSREFFPHSVGVWVKTPEELKKIDLDLVQKEVDCKQYWADGFERNIKEFYRDNNIF